MTHWALAYACIALAAMLTMLTCSLAPCLQGSDTVRNSFCFKLFDIDGDGLISYDEMVAMLRRFRFNTVGT